VTTVTDDAGASTTQLRQAPATGRASAARTDSAGRSRRQNVALLVAASVLALWLGVSAPGVSPAAPALPANQGITSIVVPASPTDDGPSFLDRLGFADGRGGRR
jgi:hypothetical protein